VFLFTYLFNILGGRRPGAR